MRDNSVYWQNKTQRAEKAKLHSELMVRNYITDIQKSIDLTEIFTEKDIISNYNEEKITSIGLVESDSVSAAFNADGKVCILNFASYKHPGGMFLNGSCAQEECLCHESTLYNVLKEQTDYYEYNNKNLNKALYTNRTLYSPEVLFEHNGQTKYIDVLTCAAPNYTAAAKYCKVTKQENSDVLRKRIRFVLSIIKRKNIDTAILGAYGCGVFGQDPTEVATIFIEEINNLFAYNCNTKFIFAIIDKNSDNYKAFDKVFSK